MADLADVDGTSELLLLPAGSTFGNYVVHECIGQGAMGNVYRAEHALLEKAVALKVLDSSLLQSTDARQRFLREGQAAAAIKHPNVVDITDVGVFEGTPYLVMELLEGEDLQIHLQRREQLSEREIASLLIPIAAALGAAHDRGVIHRDLKPSNIFLSRGPDGEVIPKILDFGISKIARALAKTDFQSTPFDQLMGSPLYLPPEAVRGCRDLTAKSDQYSLGVVLYECATGRPPFAADSLLGILSQIAAGDFVKPTRLRPDISAGMEYAILRALDPDPGLRYDHVRDLGRELLEVAGTRTQMLWGRTFGRIDLSEPPFDPRSTSPMALLRLAATPPAPAPKPRTARHVLLGVATLAAVLIPNLWWLRSSSERAHRATPLAQQPETGEAALTPARSPAANPIMAGASSAPGGALPATPLLQGEPGAILPGATLSGATLPAAMVPPASSASTVETNRNALATGVLRNERAADGPERARAIRRIRAAALPEPRSHPLSLLPDPRPRAELLPEPHADEARDPFGIGDGSEGAARDAVGRGAPGREGGQRPSPPGVYAGANESPILD
jgi:serine/threonine protein kinase